MDDVELCYTPATRLSDLIESISLSPVELVEAVLRRIEDLNPLLNAFITITPEIAIDQARAAEDRALRRARLGPMDGIPCTIKDLEPQASVRTTYGSLWYKDNIAEKDGIVAARLKAAGAVIVGKTNTPAFGHKDSCDNLLGPPCVNPWNMTRTCGGSSGGAGSAVAAGMGPVAQGSDAGGSIRIPAALCGIVGLKPSQGRVPSQPGVDYWGRTHIGPMARTVRDAGMLLSVLAGRDSRDPMSIDSDAGDYVKACEGPIDGLRVGWSADLGFAVVDAEIAQIAESAARKFETLGCEVGGLSATWFDPGAAHRIMFDVLQAARFGDLLDKKAEWIDPSHAEMINNGRKVSAVEHMRALLQRSRFYDQVHEFFETHDLLLTPQMPLAAWAADGSGAGVGSLSTVYDRIQLTAPFNLTGLPSISVPCGFTAERLPVGLQIVGKWHADALVLRAAACFEAVSPWAQLRPQLSA